MGDCTFKKTYPDSLNVRPYTQSMNTKLKSTAVYRGNLCSAQSTVVVNTVSNFDVSMYTNE